MAVSEAMDKELFVQTRLEQELRGALADESLVHYGWKNGTRHPRLGEVKLSFVAGRWRTQAER